MKVRITKEDVARVAHTVNRAYCQAWGDNSQLPWDLLPEQIRKSVMSGVRMCAENPHASPQEFHEAWMLYKLQEGWTFGVVKDAQKKEHPLLVPFDQLSKEQQAKDFIFLAVVSALIHEG